jgi:hypothetical protein
MLENQLILKKQLLKTIMGFYKVVILDFTVSD